MRIDIPEVLVHLRSRVVDAQRGGAPKPEAVAMKAAAWTLSDARRLGVAERGLGSRALWTDTRDLPAPPRESFRAWWRKR